MRIALAFIALLLPGISFWSWFSNKEDDPAQSLTQILGVSFSIITILSLLFFVLNIRVNTWIILVFLILCLGLAILGIIKNKPEFVWWHLGVLFLILGLFIFGDSGKHATLFCQIGSTHNTMCSSCASLLRMVACPPASNRTCLAHFITIFPSTV